MSERRMSEEWEQLFVDLKKMPRGAESAPQYLRHLMQMFVTDFDASTSKRLDVKFWSKLKKMMDEMRNASENDRLVDLNVQNLAVGFLTDLSLLVHYHYQIPNYGDDISTQLTWTPDMFVERKPVKSKKNCRVFMAYILLRMGDLMRYKENYPKAREFYEQSCRINPADGSVWNQLGLLSVLSAQNLESLYFHTRALHATLEFPTASGSLAMIFKKFANRDISKPMPTNELYLACLSKIHFLLEIKNFDEHLQKISEKAATSKEMIIPLMSVYEHLEDGTELEHRAVGYVKEIWRNSYRILLKTLNEKMREEEDDQIEIGRLLHLLALFYSAPELLQNVDDSETIDCVKTIVEWLMTPSEDETIKDVDRFGYFHCLEEPQYPLRRTCLAQTLEGNVIEASEVEEDSSKDTSMNETQKDVSPPRMETLAKLQLQDSSESSDEEILQRGRRRGRNPRLNESIDTDDDDF